MADELAVGVDDADVEVGDEHVDLGAGVAAADADVVESFVVAQGEFAVGVDAVGADAPVGAELGAGRAGFGAVGVSLGGGAALAGSVWSAGVVERGEGVEAAL